MPCQLLNVACVGHFSNSNLSFSPYETSHGGILGGARVEQLGGSKGGGKTTLGKVPVDY